MAPLSPDRPKSKEDENDDEKFPLGQMITLAICKFSEPIAFNSVIAYTYLMVQDLNGSDANASFYAGLLVSAYAFGEVLTAVVWGSISDRIGRKPIVLLGLCGVALSCVMFGMATNYWMALAARLIGGALNGNVAVMQTMLAEMVKKPEHEPTAYAIHPFVWCAGGIIGSAMGGYLAKPAHFYPDTFSPDGLFGKYPYLLPNLVAVVAITIAVLQGIVFLKETNPMLLAKAKAKAAHESGAHGVDETTPLINGNQSQPNGNHKPSFSVGEEGLPSTVDPHFDIRRSSFGTVHSIQVGPQNTHSQQRHEEDPLMSEQKPPFKETFNFTVVMLITSLVLTSYHSMGYGNILPIYLLDKPAPGLEGPDKLDLIGGLGYDVHQVGSFMAANGLIAVLVQAIVFPPFVRWTGVWKAFLSMTIVYPLAYAVIPFLTLLPHGPVRAVGIYGIMLVQSFLNIIIPPCALILIKNATPSSLVLGTVNGACMSLICAARTIAPPLEGLIYGAGGSAVAWFSMGGIAIVAVIQVIWVPRERADVDEVQVNGSRSESASKPGEQRERNDMRERGHDVAVEE